MKLSTSPHITSKNSIEKEMWYVILALLPVTIFGVYLFGFSTLWILVLSISSALLTEALMQKLRKKPVTVYDGSAVITGLLLALVLPPTVPLWIPIVGAFFAVAIGKHVFGGLGFNVFNPALVGRAFLVSSWPLIMTTWIRPDGVTGATPLGILKMEGTNALIAEFGSKAATYKSLFFGLTGGTIGETSALLLLMGAIFLFYKKIISWRIPLGYFGTVFILSFIFRQDPILGILAGGVMIGAFFMATDPVTSPVTKNGRLIFGIGCGILTVIIRFYSSLPEGVMYSILLMNGLTPLIDRYTKQKPFGKKNE